MNEDIDLLLRAVVRSTTTDVSENGKDFLKINDYKLFQNYPNPFNGSTTINYQLMKPGRTSLTIFDLQGKKIRTLVNEFKLSGNYNTNWDGRDFFNKMISSGIYLYELKVDNRKTVRKLMLIK